MNNLKIRGKFDVFKKVFFEKLDSWEHGNEDRQLADEVVEMFDESIGEAQKEIKRLVALHTVTPHRTKNGRKYEWRNEQWLLRDQ